MKIRLFLGAVVLIALGGCIKKPNLKQLKHLTKETSTDYYQNKDGVTLLIKKLTQEESEEILGTNLLTGKDPIVPTQISIENRSGKTTVLDEKSIDLKFVDKKTLNKRLNKDGIGVIILGSVMVPLLFFSALGGIALAAIVTPQAAIFAAPAAADAFIIGAGGLCVAIGSLVGIPYVIYKVVSTEKTVSAVNKEIQEFVKKSGLPKKSLIIPDNCDADLILFIFAKDLPTDFKTVGDKISFKFL